MTRAFGSMAVLVAIAATCACSSPGGGAKSQGGATLQAPFSCRGRASPESRPAPFVRVEPGPIVVTKLADLATPLPAPIGHAEFDSAADAAVRALLERSQVKIVAEGVSLAAVVTALSEALGVGVAIDADIVGVRVGLAMPAIPVADLLRTMHDDYAVAFAVRTGVLHIESSEGRNRRVAAQIMLSPVETRIFPATPGVSAEQIAEAFCTMMASPRGTAAVIGDRVMITDNSGNLNFVDQLINAMATAAPRAR